MTMKRREFQRYEARARIAKALAHPTRLMFLEALGGEERCVGELTDLAGVDQSTASKHLAILRQAGLVEGRKEGTLTWYRVTCPCLDRFFDCIETVLRRNLEAQKEILAR